MQVDAENIRKQTCKKLIKRFEKKGFTLGYKLEEDFYVA
jgi:DNA-binding MarR family transcriptional regulator